MRTPCRCPLQCGGAGLPVLYFCSGALFGFRRGRRGRGTSMGRLLLKTPLRVSSFASSCVSYKRPDSQYTIMPTVSSTASVIRWSALLLGRKSKGVRSSQSSVRRFFA